MLRHLARTSAAAAMCVGVAASPAGAQLRDEVRPAALEAGASDAARAPFHGTVVDDRGRPLAGAVASALGSSTVFAVTDANGRFTFHALPFGAYLLRVHLQGYHSASARVIQVTRDAQPDTAIVLSRRGDAEAPEVLAAGVGAGDPAPAATAGAGDGPPNESGDRGHDHGEVAWRLRHLKRSILKETAGGIVDVAGAGQTILDESLGSLGWAVGSPARLATSLIADVPWNGQVDLLTIASFERPQDLFSSTSLPGSVAFVSLEAPTAGGQWTMRGAVTQADLSSWMVAGSYRRAPAPHQYEAGLSYGMQRYLGGHADALAAVADGDRHAGIVYAYDDWTLSPRLALNYGARYARYGYLEPEGLVSPRAAVTVTPIARDTLRFRAAISHHVSAPGAEAFVSPSAGLWLPPERTFSTLSAGGAFVPQRTDHVELAAERTWPGDVVFGVRAFRQRVEDQIVTIFGVVLPGKTAARPQGHYYVASAGDVDAAGWGVSVARTLSGAVRASVDYTAVRARWVRPSPDADLLRLVAASALRTDGERMNDVTATLASTVPVTDTRVSVVYKLNSRLADAGAGARFDFQLYQSLPFLDSSGTRWELLVAVRSLFRDETLDASFHDELLVVRAPKHVVGGVTVRF